jgi:hypothetical protein
MRGEAGRPRAKARSGDLSLPDHFSRIFTAWMASIEHEGITPGKLHRTGTVRT